MRKPAQLYKEFPPGWDHVLVPTSSKKAALAALAMYTPCTRKAVLYHELAWQATRLFGVVALPGAEKHCENPLVSALWDKLINQWREHLGSFDTFALYKRRHRNRDGLIVLLVDGDAPRAFVKLRHETSVMQEYNVMNRVFAHGPFSFFVPRPIHVDRCRSVTYLATEPLPPFPHRPAKNPPLYEIVTEVQAALVGIHRPSQIPGHWLPMHGDFTPWNLRRVRDGRLVLVDWEHAGWGPPGADLALYQIVEAALGRPDRARLEDYEDAIAFWRIQRPGLFKDGENSAGRS
jgi:hypothetical protein